MCRSSYQVHLNHGGVWECAQLGGATDKQERSQKHNKGTMWMETIWHMGTTRCIFKQQKGRRFKPTEAVYRNC